jgi:RNA polymerase sigma-70 factor (ECF subfamily)
MMDSHSQMDASGQDDLHALRRLKNGDIGGLELLVARYQVRAVRVAFLITHDELQAEDVVQDTFVRFYRKIGQFDAGRPFEPYLLRSVVNAALNGMRRLKQQVPFPAGGDPRQVEKLLSQAASVESEVDTIQLKQTIIAALAKLEPRQRAAVVQRYYLDMSESEMAAALDTPPGTVKWLLNAARARLRELLGSERSVK